jgi:hypothetical protein
MRTRTMGGAALRAVSAVLLVLTVTGGALAQEHGRGEFGGHGRPAMAHGDRPHEHFDSGFSHDHSYLDRGYRIHDEPHTGYAIDHDRHHYWYDRGEWYRRAGADWVVVGAPVGAFVSVLPPFYTTVTVGGVPYFYANDTYYTWNGDRQEYEVAAPPEGVDSAGTAQPAPDGQLFVYPKSGASYEQQAGDRYECDISAVDQTGFDPTEENGGVSADAAPAKRADYFRAEAACLEARGYSVR